MPERLFGWRHAVDRQHSFKCENKVISSRLCRDGMHEFIDRVRGGKYSISLSVFFSLVWHFSPNLSTQNALWEQHGGKCKHFVPVMVGAFILRRYMCCMYIFIKQWVPINLDFIATVFHLLIGCSSLHSQLVVKFGNMERTTSTLFNIQVTANSNIIYIKYPDKNCHRLQQDDTHLERIQTGRILLWVQIIFKMDPFETNSFILPRPCEKENYIFCDFAHWF